MVATGIAIVVVYLILKVFFDYTERSTVETAKLNSQELSNLVMRDIEKNVDKDKTGLKVDGKKAVIIKQGKGWTAFYTKCQKNAGAGKYRNSLNRSIKQCKKCPAGKRQVILKKSKGKNAKIIAPLNLPSTKFNRSEPLAACVWGQKVNTGIEVNVEIYFLSVRPQDIGNKDEQKIEMISNIRIFNNKLTNSGIWLSE